MAKKSQEILKTFEKIQENSFLFLVTGLFAIVAFIYSFLPSLQVYDASGHLNLIWYTREYLWPFFWGWNSFTLLGFEQGISYPPAFHYLAAGLSFIFGLEISTKILISMALIALVPSFYYFAKNLTSEKVEQLIIVSWLSVLFVILPGYFGANLKALTQIGLLTSVVSLPLVFFYLGSLKKLDKGKIILPTLFLSTLILTHLVAGLLGLLILVCRFAIKLLEKRNFPKVYLTHFLATLLVPSFFWVPFLLNYSNLSVSTHPSSLSWPNLLVLVISSGLFIYFFKQKDSFLTSLSLTCILIAVALLADNILQTNQSENFLASKIYNLHLYRYQIYLYFFTVALSLVFIFGFLKKFNERFLKLLLFGPLVFAIGFLLWRNPFPSSTNLTVAKTELTGRFLETFRRTETYPLTYAVQEELIKKNKLPWSYGLFTDGTPNGPFIGSVIKSLRPEAYENLSDKFIENKIIDKEKTTQALDLFAVESLLSLEEKSALNGSIALANINGEEKTFSLKVRSEQNLVEIPVQKLVPIKANWEKQVEEWWSRSGDMNTLLVLDKEESLKENPKNSTSKVKLIENSLDWRKFSFNVDSEEEVPIIVKFGYSSNWKAFQDGRQLKIYKVSPSLMLVQAKGEVDFIYQRSIMPLLLLPVGFGTLLVLILRRRQEF